MSTSKPSLRRRRNRGLLVLGVSLAVLGLGAVYWGIGSRFVLAAPRSDSPSQMMTPAPPKSVQLQTAEANADLGPGQCEPCVVRLP